MRTFAFSSMLLGIAATIVVIGQPGTARADAQPGMQAAHRHLWVAALFLDNVQDDTGGHREKAIGLIYAALEEIRLGIIFGNDHKNPGDQPQPPGQGTSDKGQGGGADGQHWMHRAHMQLEAAKKDLERAGQDKGGHRKKALVLINEALLEVDEAIWYLNPAPCPSQTKGCEF